jgi:hypothetical protein
MFPQVDVVEVLHQQLVLDTDKAEGLVAATQAGRSFAANVIGAALLDNRAVATSLSLVFQAALQLCHRLAVGSQLTRSRNEWFKCAYCAAYLTDDVDLAVTAVACHRGLLHLG